MEQELLKNNFERHGFKTSFFDTKEAALDYLKDQISGKKVAIGGSVTAQEMGLYEALSEKNEVIWHWKKVGRETLVEARSAEVYITTPMVFPKPENWSISMEPETACRRPYSDRKKYILSLETIKFVRI